MYREISGRINNRHDLERIFDGDRASDEDRRLTIEEVINIAARLAAMEGGENDSGPEGKITLRWAVKSI